MGNSNHIASKDFYSDQFSRLSDTELENLPEAELQVKLDALTKFFFVTGIVAFLLFTFISFFFSFFLGLEIWSLYLLLIILPSLAILVGIFNIIENNNQTKDKIEALKDIITVRHEQSNSFGK